MNNKRTKLKNYQDIEDFVRGLTFMGTGGGGNPKVGINKLMQLFNDNIAIEWIDYKEIDDNDWTCCVFGMGSIAPIESKEKEQNFGIDEKVDLLPNIRAVKEIEKIIGAKVKAVVPFELGGNNTCIAINAAMNLGIKVPDGDYSGRAVPELSQVYPAINNIQAIPVVICDEWGHVIHILESPTNISTEAIGKMISTITKAKDLDALCAHAAFILRAKDMKRYLIPNTLSASLKLGRTIRLARENNNDPLTAATEQVGGKVIFKGKIIEKVYKSENGYMAGEVNIEGLKEYKNNTMKVWYKNENHLAWLNNDVIAMSPDLIVIVDLETSEPITNTLLDKDNEVGVIGIPNLVYRNEEAIKALCPKYFGFKYDYVPIEKLW
jgi:uncharacterized protein